MNYTKYSILIIAIMALVSTGCHKNEKIVGNQTVTTETRVIVAFNELINDGTFNVYYEHDTVYQIRIEAESNIIPHIRSIVHGRSLELDTQDNLHNNYPINIYVKSPEINSLILSGSGTMSADSVNTDELNLDISGSGRIYGVFWTDRIGLALSGSGSIDAAIYTNLMDSRISGSGNIGLTGTADQGVLKISGSGNINAYDLLQKESDVSISGSGSIYVTVMDHLRVDISGSGSVFYRGNPTLETNISGSGTIKNY